MRGLEACLIEQRTLKKQIWKKEQYAISSDYHLPSNFSVFIFSNVLCILIPYNVCDGMLSTNRKHGFISF